MVLISDQLQKEASKLLMGSSSHKKYSQFIRLYVRALHPQTHRHEKNEAILTLWDPSDEQLGMLQEGNVAQFRQLGVASNFHDGMLQLSANRRSTIERIDSYSGQEALDLVHFCQRKVESMLTINVASKKLNKNSPYFPEVDCSGYILMTKRVQHSNTSRIFIYLTDASGLISRIEVDDFCSSDSHFREMEKMQHIDIKQRLLGVTNLRIAPYDFVQGCAVAIWTQSTEAEFGRSENKERLSNSLIPQDTQVEYLLHKLTVGIPVTFKSPQSIAIVFGYVVDVQVLTTSAVNIFVDCNEMDKLVKVEVPQHLWHSFLPIALEVLPVPKTMLVQESSHLIKKRLVECSVFLRFVLGTPNNELEPHRYLEASRVDTSSMMKLILCKHKLK